MAGSVRQPSRPKVISCGGLTFLLVCLLHNTYGAPTITPFTEPYNLHEDTIIETRMSEVICTATGQCICNLKSTSPVSGPFQVWKKDGLTSFYVYYLGVANGGALTFSIVQSYTVTVECKDTDDNAVAQTDLEVDIQPNLAPVFTNNNYPSEALTLNARRPFEVDDTVYTVTASDAESDSLTFSIASNPDVGYFYIGSSDGIIKTSIDLRSASVEIITLTVSVSDGQSTVSGFDIVITLSNMNDAPDIVNFPLSVTISENTPSGTVIATLTITDSDAFGTPSCTVVPPAEDYKFEYIEGTRRITLATLNSGATLLDFELTSQYTITCVVTDGYRDSIGEVLTINIEDVNESPTFDEIAYYCVLTEGDAGVSTCDIDAVITDPEGDSIISVGFVSGNNSERFRYDRSSTTITFNSDYDIDSSGSNYPSSVTLQLAATDSNGVQGTVPVYFTIQDANDNTCDFGANSVIRDSADQGTPLRSVATLVATDADLRSPNNVLTYELVSANPSNALNYLQAFSDGRVEYVGLIPESAHGTTYSLTIRCKDAGSPSLSAEATVLFTYETTTTTSTTTTTTATTTTTTAAPSSDDAWDNDGFVALFVILMILLGVAFLVGLYYLLKMCGVCGPVGGAAAGARGAGGPYGHGGPGGFQSAGCGAMFQSCCMPREPPQRVRPYHPEMSYKPDPVNDNYHETSWKNGDGWERGGGSRGSAVVTVYGGRRALPPPPRHTDF